jgi:hypothetical protein
MRKNAKKYKLLIPSNLIPRIKELEIAPLSIPGFSISRMQYLISLIISHKQKNHTGAYSLLNMQYMSNVVPEADQYLNYLKKENIIEWINYSTGRNSRMYRLVDEGRTEYRSLTDMKLINRIERNNRNLKRRNSKKYPELNKYILQVRIDAQAAHDTVESEYAINEIIGPLKAEGRRTFSHCEIDRIESRNIYIKCNRTNGRLDSNYTRLPHELLQHLSINGYSLIEHDIRNSQPFFAASLFNPKPEIEKIMIKIIGPYYTMSAKALHLADYKDVKLYTSLVMNGNFYDPFLMDQFKENNISFIDRDDLKEQLFMVFFGENRSITYSPAVRLFASLFPNIYKLFSIIKKPDHTKLPILLQNIESHTILNRVAYNITEHLPGLPFITRHDSILPARDLTRYNEDLVTDVMKATIMEETGLTPVIRVKNRPSTPSNSSSYDKFFIKL